MNDSNLSLDIIYNRRSTRYFSDKAISKSILQKIIEAGTYAPTPCNQQLWNFIAIDKLQVKKRLVDNAATSTAILRVPVVIVVLYDGWNDKEALQGASMAVENMLLAATAYGIGALPINSYGNPKVIKRALDIPERDMICCFVLLGYPSEEQEHVPPIPRRPVDEVLHFNKFDRERRRSRVSYDPNNWTIEDLRSYQDYYCRKTSPGKRMEITSSLEDNFIKTALSHLDGHGLDLLTYDGFHLSLYPSHARIDCLDLTGQTSMYTRASAQRNNPNICENFLTLSDFPSTRGEEYSFASMFLKAERLSNIILQKILETAFCSLEENAELLVISRAKNPFLSFFYQVIKGMFGDDTRRTGIHAYFGPYEPVDLKEIEQTIKKSGFTRIRSKKYCIFPPIFQEFFQLLLQYLRSGGTTFLHRQRQENILTRALEKIVQSQGMRESKFGSLGIITAQK